MAGGQHAANPPDLCILYMPDSYSITSSGEFYYGCQLHDWLAIDLVVLIIIKLCTNTLEFVTFAGNLIL